MRALHPGPGYPDAGGNRDRWRRFSFIYAAFLQEAAGLLNDDHLQRLSDRMTEAGDLWREFALIGSRICKQRAAETETYAALAAILRECADKVKTGCF